MQNESQKLMKEVDELVFQEEAFKNNNENVLFILDCFAGRYLMFFFNNASITVSFISEGWGGRTSEKYLAEHCSLLNLGARRHDSCRSRL